MFMKKLVSLLFALTLCASLAAPALAAEGVDPGPISGAETGGEIAPSIDPGIAPTDAPETAPIDPTPASETEAPADTGETDPNDTGTTAETTETEMPLAASFSDVPAGHTFYDAITWAAGQGIVGGYTNGNFRPGNSVTKAQFCVMLSRAFYPDEIAKYADASGRLPWFAPNTQALYHAGVLANTSFTYDYLDANAMDQPIPRFDMAQLMTNIMNGKGFSASEAQKVQAVAEINDYNPMPRQYKDAVLNVYALGIITGYADGNFKGNITMNRGQAAVVIYRMMQYSGNTPANPMPSEPEQPETPKPPAPTTVDVTSTKTDKGTAWLVPDNNFSTGYLNNGKPVTEANVKAMLNDAQKIWPDGMTWTVDGASGNNYYGNKGAIADGYTAWQIIHGANRTDANFACGGFACMLSDYIFGPNASNPCRKLDDNTQVRPGDIVISTLNGTTTHVMIATSTVWYKSNRPGVFITNGNVSNQVDWTSTNGVPIDSYTNSAGTVAHIIYTRYPE